MKIKDLIAAVRDYPALRQALEESNTELDLSRMECAQLQSKINELEPLVDEYYQESCGKEYAANQERQKVETLKKALASFCPALDSTEQLRRFYDTIAIRERENPRCRMNHMPKKYWKNMVEMTLPPTPDDIALPTHPLTSPLPTRENAAIGAVQPRQATDRRAHLSAGNGLPDIDASPPISEEDGQHEPHVQSLKQR